MEAGENTISKTWTSTSIARTTFFPDKDRLEVEFVNGKTYQYSNFNAEAFTELLKAESIGTWFAQNIKGKYSFVQIVNK